MEVQRFLWSRNWIFRYYLDELHALKSGSDQYIPLLQVKFFVKN
jgi:hypothetical protein